VPPSLNKIVATHLIRPPCLFHVPCVDINILCRLFQYRCRQRAVFQGQNRHLGAGSIVFAVFSAAFYPWIATSTVDKKTDGDNHY
jgi:hypothetical protein